MAISVVWETSAKHYLKKKVVIKWKVIKMRINLFFFKKKFYFIKDQSKSKLNNAVTTRLWCISSFFLSFLLWQTRAGNQCLKKFEQNEKRRFLSISFYFEKNSVGRQILKSFLVWICTNVSNASTYLKAWICLPNVMVRLAWLIQKHNGSCTHITSSIMTTIKNFHSLTDFHK